MSGPPYQWLHGGYLLGALRDRVSGDIVIISGLRGEPHNDTMWVVKVAGAEAGRGASFGEAITRAAMAFGVVP